eukprot:PhF_6_TR40026/c0_g1_i2/m.59397
MDLVEQNELLREEIEVLKVQLQNASKGSQPVVTAETQQLREQANSWKMAFDNSVTQLAELKSQNKELLQTVEATRKDLEITQGKLVDSEQRVEALQCNLDEILMEQRRHQNELDDRMMSLKDQSSQEVKSLREELNKAQASLQEMKSMCQVLMIEKVKAENIAKDGAVSNQMLKELKSRLPRVVECLGEIKRSVALTTGMRPTINQKLDVVVDAVTYEFTQSSGKLQGVAKEVIELLGSILIEAAKAQKRGNDLVTAAA